MNTIHNFIKQMEVDLPTAADFMSMRSLDQYMIARQGPLEGSHRTENLRSRANTLRAYQDRHSSVGSVHRRELGASYAEFRKWQGK